MEEKIEWEGNLDEMKNYKELQTGKKANFSLQRKGRRNS